MTGLLNITLIFLLLCAITVIVFTQLLIIKKFIICRTVQNNNHLDLREIISYEKAIDKKLIRLRLELNAADIYIARFHNGGTYNNGVRIKKFSIPYEKSSSAIKELVRWRNFDKFCSHWPDVMDNLLVMREYCITDMQDCSDLNFKRDMEFYNFKSCHLFLIEQLDLSHSPEGFLAVNFFETRVLEKDERDLILSEIPNLLSLINLTKGIKET